MIPHHTHKVTPHYYRLAQHVCKQTKQAPNPPIVLMGYWSGELFYQVEPNYRLRIECENGQLRKVTIEKSN